MLRFVVLFVQLARHIPPEISDQRSFQLRIRPPQQQRVHARMLVRLQNRFVEQRLGFPRTRRAAEETILRHRIVKFLLARKWLVLKCFAEFVEARNTLLGHLDLTAINVMIAPIKAYGDVKH